MGFYMGPVTGQIMIALFTIIPILIRIAIITLVVIFLIKAIKYMGRKDRRESYTAYQREKTTLEDIERDLNNHKD